MARKRKRGGGTVREEAGRYEKLREMRVKENRERMHKLGIFDLSLKLKPPSDKTSTGNVSAADNKTRNPRPLSVPPRRSSRLMTLPPVKHKDKRPKSSMLSGDDTVIEEKDVSFLDVNLRQEEKEGQADFDGKKVEMKRVQWMDFLGKELVKIREFATR